MGFLKAILASSVPLYLASALVDFVPQWRSLFAKQIYPNASFTGDTGAALQNTFQVIGALWLSLTVLNYFSLSWGSDARWRVGVVNLVAWGSIATVSYLEPNGIGPFVAIAGVASLFAAGLLLNYLEPGILTADKDAKVKLRKRT